MSEFLIFIIIAVFVLASAFSKQKKKLNNSVYIGSSENMAQIQIRPIGETKESVEPGPILAIIFVIISVLVFLFYLLRINS